MFSNDDEDWLRDRWLDLVTPFTSDHFGVHATYHALASCYSDVQRKYHNLQHVAALLRLADEAREQAVHPEVLEFAIWFHGAIYDSRAQDNERKNAAWARQALEAIGASPVMVGQVESCILATQTHTANQTEVPDLHLFLDLDLAVLGAPDEVYDSYSRRIREEYAWASDAEYRSGRVDVLQRFEQRASLYYTPSFAARFEAQARHNIARELQSLQSG